MSARVANRRIRLLLAVFVLAFGVAFLRAAWLQGVRAASFGRLASSQHSEEVTIPAARGTLYDRGGVQLAIGEQATTVYADPRRVADPRSEAPIVAKSLRLDPNEVYSALTDRSRGFVYVARKADPTLAAKLARKGLPGLGFCEPPCEGIACRCHIGCQSEIGFLSQSHFRPRGCFLIAAGKEMSIRHGGVHIENLGIVRT